MKANAIAKSLAAVLATAAATSAFADTVTTGTWTNGGGSANIQTGGPVTYPPAGGPSLTLVPDPKTVGAGQFTATWHGKTFETVCLDIFDNLSFGVTYSDWSIKTAASFMGAGKASDLGKLWTVAHDNIGAKISDTVTSAGFQLAVWEVVYENTGTYDVNGANLATRGLFWANSASPAGTIAAAATFLAEMQAPGVVATPLYVLDSLGDAHPPHGATGVVTQDLLTPVPEPETYAMFLAGLGMMGIVARRRVTGRS